MTDVEKLIQAQNLISEVIGQYGGLKNIELHLDRHSFNGLKNSNLLMPTEDANVLIGIGITFSLGKIKVDKTNISDEEIDRQRSKIALTTNKTSLVEVN